ncbi:MAG: HAD family hydrolase [Acutalibacteraceae bacterium]
MIDTIIFDLDGTLLNTLDDLMDSVNFALSAFSLKERSREEIRRFVGNGVTMLIKRSVPEGTSEEMTKRVFSVFREHYLKNMENKTAPYEGIMSLLEEAKRQGIKTGVVSNKLDEAVKGLCEKTFGGLIGFAQGAQGEDDRKPNPINVFKCVEALGSETENCVYVGDSEVDFQTAQNAQMKCINVLWGFRKKEEMLPFGADTFISKPSELLGLIKEMNKK